MSLIINSTDLSRILGKFKSKLYKSIDNKVEKNDFTKTLEFASTSGSETAYTVTTDSTTTIYQDGMKIIINPHVNCGDSPTLNWNNLGELPIIKSDGSNLKSGDIIKNNPILLVKIGNNFIFNYIDSTANNIKLESISGINSTNVQDGIAELFQSASNGKSAIAGVVGNVTGSNSFTEIKDRIQTDKNTIATNITNKGITASNTELLGDLANKIGNISISGMGGKRFATGTSQGAVVKLSFKPKIILIIDSSDECWTYSEPVYNTYQYPAIFWRIGSGSDHLKDDNYYVTSSSFSFGTGTYKWYAWE